jgi:hypothetical protein
VLVDSEYRAAVKEPNQVPESGVGVLVEHWLGAEQRPIPRAADFYVAHGDCDVVESGESHGSAPF